MRVHFSNLFHRYWLLVAIDCACSYEVGENMLKFVSFGDVFNFN